MGLNQLIVLIDGRAAGLSLPACLLVVLIDFATDLLIDLFACLLLARHFLAMSIDILVLSVNRLALLIASLRKRNPSSHNRRALFYLQRRKNRQYANDSLSDFFSYTLFK